MFVFEQGQSFWGRSAALSKEISLFHLLTHLGAPHGLPDGKVLLLGQVSAKLDQLDCQGPIKNP